VARGWREQEDGQPRPIGPPPCEDKSVHRAVAMLREAIDAHDGSDSAYGFRRGRSPQDALDALRARCMRANIGGRVDADGRGYFARSARSRLREGRRQRVNEGSLRRLRGKWRRAGGMAEGRVRHPETGGVQGGGMAPGWAPRVLHQVRAEWCEQEGPPRLQGRGFRMRFAEDFSIGCALQADAHRMMAVLPKRVARDGLALHPTKTALMACSKPETPQGAAEGNGTFDFRGLPHAWTRSRRGDWGSKRRTAKKRLRRTKKSLWRWCRQHRHPPLPYQSQQVGQQ
jgi:RNA-directed DNA polymerase